jgi:hypothetical protein
MCTRCMALPVIPTTSSTASTVAIGSSAIRLRGWTDRFTAALAGAPVEDGVLPAVLHTIEVFGLDRADFAAFLRSMEMDLTVTDYQTCDDLLGYMEGSAAAIGTMMLPILGAADPARAREDPGRGGRGGHRAPAQGVWCHPGASAERGTACVRSAAAQTAS